MNCDNKDIGTATWIHTEHESEGRVKEAGSVGIDRSGNGQVGGHLTKRRHEAVDHRSNQAIGNHRVSGAGNVNRRSRGQEQTRTDGSSCKSRAEKEKRACISMIRRKKSKTDTVVG